MGKVEIERNGEYHETMLYSPCLYCRHVRDLGDGGLGGWTCTAWPKGIPQEILERKKEHTEVMSGQEGQDVYTPKLYEFREGRVRWVDFGGQWWERDKLDTDINVIQAY